MAQERRISDWYREKIEEEPSSPPSEVWENIENELDIDQVWKKVSNQLDSIKLFSAIKKVTYYSAAAVALFFMLAYFLSERSTHEIPDQESVSQKNFDEGSEEEKSSDAEEKAATNETVVKPVQNIEKPPEISETGDAEKIPSKVESTGIAPSSVWLDHPSAEPGPQKTKSMESWAKADSLLTVNPLKTNNGYFMTESTDFYPIWQVPCYEDLGSATAEGNSYLRGFYLGISAQLGNTWLINNTTVNGLKSNELTTTVPYFGKSFGLLAGTNLSEKFALQFEGAILDETGQKYHEYIHGKYVTRVLSLDYTTFHIHVRYTNARLWAVNTPLTSNLIFGPYASYLKSASESIDADAENIKYHYENLDFGMIVGYEFDFHLKRGFLISTGLRIKMGIPNVYAGNELIPSTFNKTRTAAVNLSLGLKYFIPRE